MKERVLRYKINNIFDSFYHLNLFRTNSDFTYRLHNYLTSFLKVVKKFYQENYKHSLNTEPVYMRKKNILLEFIAELRNS